MGSFATYAKRSKENLRIAKILKDLGCGSLCSWRFCLEILQISGESRPILLHGSLAPQPQGTQGKGGAESHTHILCTDIII